MMISEQGLRVELDWFEREDKTPRGAWNAFVMCSHAGIPAPKWCAEIFDQVMRDYLSGHLRSLDYAFGVKSAGKGKTPEVKKRIILEQEEKFFRKVWKLTLAGVPIIKACTLVQERSQTKNNTIYAMTGLSSTPERLERLYYKWKKKNKRYLDGEESEQKAILQLQGIESIFVERKRRRGNPTH
jgi:hypothetical protein